MYNSIHENILNKVGSITYHQLIDLAGGSDNVLTFADQLAESKRDYDFLHAMLVFAQDYTNGDVTFSQIYHDAYIGWYSSPKEYAKKQMPELLNEINLGAHGWLKDCFDLDAIADAIINQSDNAFIDGHIFNCNF